MRISMIVAAIWTAFLIWTCGEALYAMRGPQMERPGAHGGVLLGMILMFLVWVAGLGAIAIVRYLAGGWKKTQKDPEG